MQTIKEKQKNHPLFPTSNNANISEDLLLN